MQLLQYVAGFGPKDLMGLLYLPALGILLIGSIVVLIIKRKGHPYTLALLASPLASLIWYLYDRLQLRSTDKSQALLLAGSLWVFGLFMLASTSLIPDTNMAVNVLAILANSSTIPIIIMAILQRDK